MQHGFPGRKSGRFRPVVLSYTPGRRLRICEEDQNTKESLAYTLFLCSRLPALLPRDTWGLSGTKGTTFSRQQCHELNQDIKYKQHVRVSWE